MYAVGLRTHGSAQAIVHIFASNYFQQSLVLLFKVITIIIMDFSSYNGFQQGELQQILVVIRI